MCTRWNIFINYHPSQNATIRGIGLTPVPVLGQGTVELKFTVAGKTITHQLLNVSHVPSAPNCLMSQGCFDENGGQVETHGGKCYLKNRTGQVVSEGHMVNHLYLLEARADLRSNEKAFVTGVQEYLWDEWHKW